MRNQSITCDWWLRSLSVPLQWLTNGKQWLYGTVYLLLPLFMYSFFINNCFSYHRNQLQLCFFSLIPKRNIKFLKNENNSKYIMNFKKNKNPRQFSETPSHWLGHSGSRLRSQSGQCWWLLNLFDPRNRHCIGQKLEARLTLADGQGYSSKTCQCSREIVNNLMALFIVQ